MAKEALLRLHGAIVKQHESMGNDSAPLDLKASESMVLRSLIRCCLDKKPSHHSHSQDKSKYTDLSTFCELAAARLERLGFESFFLDKSVGELPCSFPK